MDSGRYHLILTLGVIHVHARQIILALSLAVSPIIVQAAAYQTYVIATYGGEALLPAVRQQLQTSQDGGSVATYQDKLVLRTSAANYQAVQQLLAQIDTQPAALTVAVRVGNNSSAQGTMSQGRVIISNRGIQGTGVINQRSSQQQNSRLYQVQTLSGSAASISTGTLWSLTQNYTANDYNTRNRPLGQIIIQQHVLLPTTQGIQVTPRLLPNGQVEVRLSQTEEVRVPSITTDNRHAYPKPAIQRQGLYSTIIVPRGQWVTIGQVTQNVQHQRSSYAGSSVMSSNNSAPIWLLVQ